MATGYEHMTDHEFWTKVAELLGILVRHHEGSPAAYIGGLADYVHEEAERRDPELAALARACLAMVKAADARVPFDPMDMEVHFTAEEDVEYDRLRDAYNERFAGLATDA